jgi:hypothetical protein
MRINDKIKFIEYTGKYPTLCSGTLVILFKGEEYHIRGWESGGSISFDDNWNDYVWHGDWSIDKKKLPSVLQPFHSDIEKLMNENVEKGCCGGCI